MAPKSLLTALAALPILMALALPGTAHAFTAAPSALLGGGGGNNNNSKTCDKNGNDYWNKKWDKDVTDKKDSNGQCNPWKKDDDGKDGKDDKDCKDGKGWGDKDKDCKDGKGWGDKDKDCKDKDDDKDCKDKDKDCDKDKDKDCKDKDKDKDGCNSNKCKYKVTTTSYGCGCENAHLWVSLNKYSCCLNVSITANKKVIEGFYFLGTKPLDEKVATPIPPFFNGCFLLIDVFDRVDFVGSGSVGCIDLPDYPTLVGQTYEMQGMASFEPLLSSPTPVDYNHQFLALTQAVHIEFN